MKKRMFAALTLAALLAAPCEVQAQAFLKKLKEKAEAKVAEAVLGTNKNKSNVSTKSNDSSNESEESYIDNYAESLLDVSVLEQGFSLPQFGNGDSDGVSAEPRRTIAQVMAMRSPYFPASIVTEENYVEKIEKARIPVEKAYIALHTNNPYTTNLNDIAMMRANNAQSRMNPEMSKIGMEVMQLAMKKGINLEKATEAQMKEISAEVMGKKLGVPTAEMKKMVNMSPKDAEAYMTKNYPAAIKKAKELGLDMVGVDDDDESGSKYDKYIEELDKLMASYNDGAGRSDNMVTAILTGNGTPERVVLEKLCKEIMLSWATSDACAKVKEMETANNARLLKWMKDNNKNYNDTFPSWWKESRLEQNKVIANWNVAQAEKWNAKLKEIEVANASTLKRVAEIDAEIDKIAGSNTNEVTYKIAKMKVGGFLRVLHDYLAIPYYIIACPQAGMVSTIDTV